ncbi:hypothetical protein [Desulfobulbus propionicus]|uniref:hypothetical protein n=1 Tax=Desulfobulbus propionicus TaxID=894 RepID=UPI0005C19F3E|nr:hypothetical protein [Desulfobulbus propionicus]
MKTSQIVPDTIETAFADDPELIALIASSQDESVEVLFKTVQAPAIAASILLSSQDAVRRMDPKTIFGDLDWNLDTSMRILPEAVDITLAADGEVLCINVGSGTLFFRLGNKAQRAINKPLEQH